MDFGLTSAEFWRLTMRQFVRLVDRKNQHRRQDDMRFGVLATLIAEPNRDRKKRHEPYEPAFFFPSLAEDRAQVEEKIISVDEMRERFMEYATSSPLGRVLYMKPKESAGS